MEIKNKKIFILIFALLIIVLGCPLAFADYIVKGDLAFNKEEIECDENNISAGNYVEFDYNDAFSSPYYFYTGLDKVTINASSIPMPENKLNHVFQGWYLTKSGYTNNGESSKIEFPYTFDKGTRVYAKYTSSGNVGTYISGSTYIDNGATNSNYYYINSSTISIDKEISINEGGKISIRYAGGTEFSETTLGTDKSIKYIEKADVVGILDSDIDINGGVLQLNSIFGFMQQPQFSNCITGNFTALDLNGYTITVHNNGLINGYGIIFNSQNTGGIIVEDGTITSIFTPADYKAGGPTCLNYVTTNMEFGQFLCPYLTCEVVFSKFSVFNGYTSLNAGEAKHSTTIPLISGKDTNTLFYITNGYIIKQTTDYYAYQKDKLQYGASTSEFEYYSTQFREKIIFTNNPEEHLKSIKGRSFVAYDKCNISVNDIRMHIEIKVVFSIKQDVSLKYVDFPIPSFYDIVLNNADVSIPISLVAMPGSTINVDENSTVYFTNSYDSNVKYYIFGRLTVLPSFQNDLLYLNSSNKKASPSTYLCSTLYSTMNKPAIINMNGLFKFNESNVDFNTNYKYYTIGGKINLNEQALNSLSSYSSKIYLQNKFFYPGYVGEYSYFPLQYFSQPLLSNGKAYLQTSLGGDIIECNYVDEKNDIYGNDSQYYFLKYTNDGAMNSKYGMTNFLSTSSPQESEYKKKHQNTDGLFSSCNATYVPIGYQGREVVYITSGNQKYIKASGAYIKTSSTITLNSYFQLNHISVNTSNKFTLSTTIDGYSVSSELYYDYLTDTWRFYYAEASN